MIGIQFRSTYAQTAREGLKFPAVLIIVHLNRLVVVKYFCFIRYNALDALRLVSLEDEFFHCEHCNGELVEESDKLAAEEMGDGDDNARRRRREKFRDMLQKFEVWFSI